VEREELLARKREFVERYGDWTAHDILLGEGISTRGGLVSGDEHRLRRVVQIVSDLVAQPIAELRVLDLACLEGLYSVEFAKRGAEVVGIEGREANVAKARFAQEALGLDSLEFLHDDVRNLSAATHGEFDVVLCIGILYHLDAPDVFAFLERLGEVCRRLAVIDTHVALSPRSVRSHAGHEYRGISFVEHSAASAPEAREESVWASLDNPRSFWPTRPSLLNALERAGFTSVYECELPARPGEQRDRATFVAVKGAPEALVATPTPFAEPPEAAERGRRRPLVAQLPGAPLLLGLALDAKARWRRVRR